MRYNTKWDGKCLTLCEDKNPLSVTEIIVPDGIEFIDDEGNKGVGNVYLEWSSDDKGNAVIYPRI